MRADLHVHTIYSRDCAMPLETIIKVAKKRHLECLAITDHNTILGALEMKEIAPFTIVVGEEIRTTQGEIIGLFLQEEIPPQLSPEKTISRIKEQGGIVCIPHPFDRVRRSRLASDCIYSLASQIDVIEVHNSRTTFEADNALADEFARTFGLLKSGGSDAHSEMEIGRTHVEMPPFATKEEFLRGLAQAKVVGKRSIPLVHLFSSWSKLTKRYLR